MVSDGPFPSRSCRRGRLWRVRAFFMRSRPTPTSSRVRPPKRARTTTPHSTSIRRPTTATPGTLVSRSLLPAFAPPLHRLHISKGRKLFACGRPSGRACRVPPRRRNRPRQRGRAAGNRPRAPKQGTNAPAPEVGLPQPSGEQQELGRVELSARAPPALQRAALAAHD